MSELPSESDQELRPTIFGFSLEKLRGILGSHDLDLVGRLRLVLSDQEEDSDELPETFAQAGKIIEEAVTKGAPFSNLVEEKEAHVLAAIALAGHDQDITPTDSESWHVNAFWTLAGELGQELEPEPRKILSFLCDGRPIFGKLFDTDKKYYGYLTYDEIKSLSADLAGLEEHISDWEDPGTVDFVRDLTGWLNAIVEAEQDLWCHVG